MRFRRYEMGHWDSPRYGWVLDIDRTQPTLDIYIHRVVYVIFWRKK